MHILFLEVVDSDVQVASLSSRQDILDRVDFIDLSVIFTQLIPKHLIITRTKPVHAIVDDILDGHVPSLVDREEIVVGVGIRDIAGELDAIDLALLAITNSDD